MKHLFLAAILIAPTTALSQTWLGRCQMGECVHDDQTSRQVVGEGSATVPGELVLVTLRSAISDRPDTPAGALTWEAPSPVQVFCSPARPAFRTGDGGYTTLDLVTPADATTMVTTMYLRACHPDTALTDHPFTDATRLGYRPYETGTYESFKALLKE